MRAAATEVLLERLLDFVVGRLAVLLQKRRGLHDHAVDAITALDRLLIDERLLQRMRTTRRAQAFERDDLLSDGSAYRQDARADRLAVDMDRACAALTETASEARSMEPHIVTERVEQRHLPIVDRERRGLTVDIEGDLHGGLLSLFIVTIHSRPSPSI